MARRFYSPARPVPLPNVVRYTQMATREQVIAAHLRYSAVAEPLRTRAHAQILAKVFYLSGERAYLTMSKMRDGFAELTGGARPSRKDTQAALRYLEGAGSLRNKGRSHFGLRPAEHRRLGRQVNAQADLVDGCLTRHFPGEIDREALTTWFNRVSISFFERFADRWVANVVGQAGFDTEAYASVMDLARKSAVALAIKFPVDDLADGFVRFLRSNEHEDHQLLQSMAFRAFAARLVAADEGPDPVSTAELRDATWLLDTNILVTIALEGVAHGDPLDPLGQAMSMIGSKLVYLHPTLAEYRGLVDRWRDQTLIALDRFGIGPIRESSDPFLKIAVARHCHSREDFSRFFDELRRPPRSIENRIAVELVDDLEVARIAAKGEENEADVLRIRSHWSEQRSRPKPLMAARHDAALSEVVRYWRSSNKRCFVLTTDRTMADLAARLQGPSGTPSWILLDGLVQVLAADRAGMPEDRVGFSALLAKLIATEVGPVDREFQLQDLLWASEIVEQVEAFPEEVVNDLARIVHRKRLAGARRDDPELRLALERTIQEARDSLIKGHDSAVQDAARATGHAEDAGARGERLRDALVNSTEKALIRRARWGLVGRSMVVLTGAAVVALVAHMLVSWAFADSESPVDRLSVGIGIASLLVPISVAAFKWIWPKYREARDAALDEAVRQTKRVEGTGS